MKRFDGTVLFGAFVGLAAIIGSAWLEGLNLAFLWHPTAGLIVVGGTLGALIIRRGTGGVVSAVRAVWNLRVREDAAAHNVDIAKLAWLSRTAQKSGVKAFENDAETCGDAL